MYNEPKPKHRQLKEGQRIVLTKEITNGDVSFPIMERGKIVHAQNNVEANIWMTNEYPCREKLNLATDFHKNGRFEGVVLNIKGDSFAIHFNYQNHSNIIISEEKALEIPFFDGWEDKKKPSNLRIRVGDEMKPQYEYLLTDIIDYIEDAFSDWVQNNLEMREITEEEKESGEFPYDWDRVFTNESQIHFTAKQNELELKFARHTGFYQHFLGGTIED